MKAAYWVSNERYSAERIIDDKESERIRGDLMARYLWHMDLNATGLTNQLIEMELEHIKKKCGDKEPISEEYCDEIIDDSGLIQRYLNSLDSSDKNEDNQLINNYEYTMVDVFTELSYIILMQNYNNSVENNKSIIELCNEINQFELIERVVRNQVVKLNDVIQYVDSIEMNQEDRNFCQYIDQVVNYLINIEEKQITIPDFNIDTQIIKKPGYLNVLGYIINIDGTTIDKRKFSSNINAMLREITTDRAIEIKKIVREIDDMLGHKSEEPYRIFLKEYERRTLGVGYLMFTLNLKEYADIIKNFLAEMISKVQYMLSIKMAYAANNESIPEISVGDIQNFIDCVNDSANKHNDLNGYSKKESGSPCMAFISMIENGNEILRFAFSNFGDIRKYSNVEINRASVNDQAQMMEQTKIREFYDPDDKKQSLIKSFNTFTTNLHKIARFNTATQSYTKYDMRRYFIHGNPLNGKYQTLEQCITDNNNSKNVSVHNWKDAIGDFTCCERKILSDIDLQSKNINKCEVFAKHEICPKCMPDFTERIKSTCPSIFENHMEFDPTSKSYNIIGRRTRNL